MRNLLLGIIDFRQTVLPQYRTVFKDLTHSQSPDCLFFACADSRVVPNMFASTKPGELFTIRNVGNLVTPCQHPSHNHKCQDHKSHDHKSHDHHPDGEFDSSIGAAVEFAGLGLKVKDIIVCGHSNCGAMKALLAQTTPEGMPHLSSWLRAAQPSLEMYRKLHQGKITYETDIPGLEHVEAAIDTNLPVHDQLSQINAMWQLENLMTYTPVRERVLAGNLRLHAWWFDIGNADVYTFSPRQLKFVLLDETKARYLMDKYFTQEEKFVFPWMQKLKQKV